MVRQLLLWLGCGIAISTGFGCEADNRNTTVPNTSTESQSRKATKVTDASEEVSAILKGADMAPIFQSDNELLVFRPYSNIREGILKEMTGADEIKSDIGESDGINLLVFIRSDAKQVLGWADVPRNVADFAFDSGSSFTMGHLSAPKSWVEAIQERSTH
jgi:hypothetical protein